MNSEDIKGDSTSRSGEINTAHTWRCFHCDEVFTDHDEARLHFGPSIYSEPSCRVSPERLRELELQIDAYRQEDTELHRAMHGMQCKHQLDLRREEEAGYARGLRDGRPT